MTKKEIVKVLVDEYGVEDKGLMKKTVAELKTMLEGVKKESGIFEDAGETVITEEVNAEEFEDELDDAIKIEKSEIKTEGVVSEVQLNIYETVVRRFEPPKNLQIENLGAGDVYVGETKENLIQEGNKMSPGHRKYIPDVSVLYITSASRPVIRIVY